MTDVLFSVPLSEALPDLGALANTPVPNASPGPMVGRRAALEAHLRDLEQEFGGLPQLFLFHAVLIVHIRRDIDSGLAWRQFREVWMQRRSDLLAGLSARWLVSACDTIMDHAPEPYERAMACNASTFLNTLKLFETERRSYGPPHTPLSELRQPVPIFDGMTSFAVGFGDMIASLRQRTEAVCQAGGESIAADLMREALKRADRADTVYRRLAAVHTRDTTRWVLPEPSSR